MIKNKKVAILGLGREGFSTVNYLYKKNELVVIDQSCKENLKSEFLAEAKNKGVQIYLDGKLPKNKNYDFIVRSPAIRPDNSLIKSLSGKIITSTQIFFDKAPCKIIGITGTKGKGTTATLIYKILKESREDVYLAGNIGTPSLEILPKLKKDSIAVLELSSFQLFDLKKSPNIAVVLMIVPEHLDWHKNFKEYTNSKKNILKYQNSKDTAIIDVDSPFLASFIKETPGKKLFISKFNQTKGAYLKNGKVVTNLKIEEELMDAGNIKLPGEHNISNILAAALVTKILKVPNEIIAKTVRNFEGMPHRLQFVRSIKDIKFYNDSASTIPETTIAAIKSFKNPKVIIIGGASKKSDFSKLAKEIVERDDIKGVILLGKEKEKILNAINAAGDFTGGFIKQVKTLEKAVAIAYKLSRKNDIVILSPACASFDMFTSYEQRGNRFVELVNKLDLSKNA